METPSPDEPPRRFNSTAALISLVALPLAALVIWIVVGTLGTKDDDAPGAAAAVEAEKSFKAPAAEETSPKINSAEKSAEEKPAQPLAVAEEPNRDETQKANEPAKVEARPAKAAPAVTGRPPPWQAA